MTRAIAVALCAFAFLPTVPAGGARGQRRRRRAPRRAVAGRRPADRTPAATAAAPGARADGGRRGARRRGAGAALAAGDAEPELHARDEQLRADRRRHADRNERHARPVVQHLQLLPEQHQRDASCIWDFGQTWQKRKAARAIADAQEDAEQTTQLAADYSIRSAFYTARATRDAVGVARETLANQNKHVDQIQAFTEVGTRPEIDLLQARTDQANAEVALINAQNDYATARALLNQAMGVEAPASYEVTARPSPPLPGEETPLETLVDEALRAAPTSPPRSPSSARRIRRTRRPPDATALPSRRSTGARTTAATSTVWSGTGAAASRSPGRSSRAAWRALGGAKAAPSRRRCAPRSTSPASRSASTSTRRG